ncbi:hypothetical protein MIMGU_mgv1a0033112mg, partial [Erythranthe guttata]
RIYSMLCYAGNSQSVIVDIHLVLSNGVGLAINLQSCDLILLKVFGETSFGVCLLESTRKGKEVMPTIS